MIKLKETQVIHGRRFDAGETFPLKKEGKDDSGPLFESDPALEAALVVQDKADELDDKGNVVTRNPPEEVKEVLEEVKEEAKPARNKSTSGAEL